MKKPIEQALSDKGRCPRRFAPGLISAFLVVFVPMLFGGPCPQAYLQYKSASTNGIRLGRVAFTKESGPTHDEDLQVFRKYVSVSRNKRDVEVCSDEDAYGREIVRTNTQTWSLSYWRTDVASGGAAVYECGYLPPDEDHTVGFDYYYWIPSSGPSNGCLRTYSDGDYTPTNACPDPTWRNNGIFEYGGSVFWGITESGVNETERYEKFTITNAPSCIGSSGGTELRETLTNEYTVDQFVTDMREDVLGNLDAQPWLASGGASFNLSPWGMCGGYRAMKYQFTHRAGCDVEYEVVLKKTYSIVYRDHSTSWVEFERHSFTGDEQWHTSEIVEVRPPEGSGVRASSVTVEIVSPGADGCGGGDSCTFGSLSAEDCTGVSAYFGLGTTSTGVSPGGLGVQGTAIGSGMVGATAATRFINQAAVEKIGSPPSQLRVNSGLVSLAEGTDSLTLAFYTQVGTKDTNTGLYPIISNSLVSSYVITYTSTGTGGSTVSRLRIQPSGGAYTEFINSNSWMFVDRGDGHWNEGRLLITNSTGVVLTNRHRFFNASGGTLSESETVYAQNLVNSNRYLVSQVIGTGSDAQTNRWDHGLDLATNHVNYGKLVWRVDERGGWEHRLYSTNGLLSKKVVGFGNAGTNANENTCRVFTYSYTPFHSNDSGLYEPDTPRVILEKLTDVPIRMAGTAIWADNRMDVQFAKGTGGSFLSESNWSEPENLRTLTASLTLSNGTGAEILSPGGLIRAQYSLTNSAGTYRTNIAKRCALTSSNSVVCDTREVSVTDLTTGKMLTHRVYDDASGVVLSEEVYSYSGALNETYTITHLDGRTETHTGSGCCGGGSSIDLDGVAQERVLDVRRREVLSKRLGIVTSNYLDTVGNVLERWMIGTNGTAIRVSASTYDTAGRLRTTTDALGHVTSNSYFFANDGRSVHRTDNPDQSFKEDYYNRDGSLERTIGTAVLGKAYSYGVSASPFATFTRSVPLATNEVDETGEWTKTHSDEFGNSRRTEFADGAYSEQFFEAGTGRMVRSVDPDGVTTVYEYGLFGEVEVTGVDVDRDGLLASAVDRRTRTVRDLTTHVWESSTVPVTRSITYIWNGSSEVAVATNEVAVNGTASWNTRPGGEARSQTDHQTPSNRVVIAWGIDESHSEQEWFCGRMTSVRYFMGSVSNISSQTFGYDEFGRQNTVTDARNGTTKYQFDALGRVASVTAASGTALAQTTTNVYDAMGRVIRAGHPDGTWVTNLYFANGLLKAARGSRTYPVEYSYDAQGRMKTMTTWQDFRSQAGAAVTTWNYDSQRGWLTNKLYTDNNGPKYQYTPAGRLAKRTWARGVTTTYTNDNAGQLKMITYSDGTPQVAFSYDVLGRATNIIDGTGTNVMTFDGSGLFLSHKNGAGLTVTNGYDPLRLRTAVGLASYPATLVEYGYENASRLTTVSSGTNHVSYSIVEYSRLIGQVTFNNGSVGRMVTTKQYDLLNRLMAVTNTPSAEGAAVFNYANNTASQRTAITNADGSRWVYEYDALGQVVSGKKFWSDGTPVLGQQFDYTFDDIGNRKSATTGGDTLGRNKRTQTYGANSLNQYTNRTVPGWLDIVGTASNAAAVVVNNVKATRKGDYFRAEIPVANNAGPVWQTVTNTAALAVGTNDHVTNWVGRTFVPAAVETFKHDADGNMTNDGRWALFWDGENRLIRQESLPGAPVGSSNRLTFAYDHQSRRVSKATEAFTNGTWTIILSNRFVYDGWNLLAELNATDNGVINSYVWGLDLSGSMQGAGGVGGLLMITMTNAGTHFAGCDGNGNVTLLVNATNGSTSAVYEYDPFGGVIRATGPVAGLNPMQFSTKYQDGESGWNYYGYRSYNSQIGRWVSRDSFEDGNVLYAFVKNDAISSFDPDGQITVTLVRNQQSPFKGKCGSFSFIWRFSLDAPAPCDGYLVQQVTIHDHQQYPCDTPMQRRTTVYYEAFKPMIRKGTGGSAQDWAFTLAPATREGCGGRGYYESYGVVKFVCRKDAPEIERWSDNSVRQANGLPASYNAPSGWSSASANDGRGRRMALADYDCCCPSDTRRDTVLYFPQ